MQYALQKNFYRMRKESLIGVEADESMYALAYANMRFHGDGKSNLFNCSSLLKDSYFPVDDRGKTYHMDDRKISLAEALRTFGAIDIGMINPHISTTSENNGVTTYVPESNRDGNLITLAYDGSIGACFYQRGAFFASEKIVTINTVKKQFKVTPDYAFMEQYIMSRPFSGNIR